jgi:hypothetical protein
VSSRPNYSAYTNSCQNFVIYLVESVCPGSVVTPKTFKEAVDGLILEWNISQTKKRMPDQSYSSIEANDFSKDFSFLWSRDERGTILVSAVLF